MRSGPREVHPRFGPRRGAARATTWWGKAWVRALEESAYGEADLRVGRALARSGRIGGISVDDAGFWASVADGDELWTVTGGLDPWGADAVAAFTETVAAEAGRVAALLAGDLPHTLVEHAEEAGAELLPFGGELRTTCSCEPWADPCPHALGVLYQLAWLVEADPLLLLRLRGLDRAGLLARLEERGVGEPAPESGPDDPDLAVATDAAVRAARLLELLEGPDADPDAPTDHLW